MVRKPVFGKQSRTVRASAVSDKLSIDVDGVEMLGGGSDVAVSEDVQSLSKKLHALRRETNTSAYVIVPGPPKLFVAGVGQR